MLTDPIADFLTRLRNASLAQQTSVDIPYSKLKEGIAQVMQRHQFISTVKTTGDKQNKILQLELPQKKLTLNRISKPGQRIYTAATDLHQVLNGFGIAVVSTSQGVMSGREARQQNLGGELLCTIS